MFKFKKFTIITGVVILICLITALCANAAEYCGNNLKSGAEFAGLKTMSEPLKKLFLSLSPQKVDGLCPNYLKEKKLEVKLLWQKESGEIVGLKTINPELYPISTMDVEFFPPHTKGLTDENQYLCITYNIVNPLGETAKLFNVGVMYWPSKEVGKSKYSEIVKNTKFIVPGAPENLTIDGVQVYAPVSVLKVADTLIKGKDIYNRDDQYGYKNFKVINEYRFAYGNFAVVVHSYPGDMEFGCYSDTPSWVSEWWPKLFKLVSLKASGFRDIQPLVKEIISILKSEPAIEPTVELAAPKNPKLSLAFSQVIDNPSMLVHKKPALLAVKLNWDNKDCATIDAQINWTRNGKLEKSMTHTFKRDSSVRDISEGKDAALFPFLPDIDKNQAEKQAVEVVLKGVKDKKGAPIVLKKDISMPVDSMGNPVINILFVPVKIGSWDSKKIYNDQGERLSDNYFKKIRNKQLEFLRGLYPVPPESVRDVTKSNFLMEITPAASEKYLTGVTTMGLLSRLEDIYNDYKKEGVNYVVGIVPSGWMKDVGLTDDAFPQAVILDEGAYGTILSHELGHHLKFFEYANVKFLKHKHNQDEYGKAMLSSDGYWIKGLNPFVYERILPVKVKANTYDFMDKDPRDVSNSWICRENYAKLVQAVKNFFGSFIKSN